jgi:hypothetical protein
MWRQVGWKKKSHFDPLVWSWRVGVLVWMRCVALFPNPNPPLLSHQPNPGPTPIPPPFTPSLEQPRPPLFPIAGCPFVLPFAFRQLG